MASFDKMAVWPVGHYRAITSWLLRNRKEVAARIDCINAEIARIGFVKVKYMTETDQTTGATVANETRIALAVTPNSSLGMLTRAYIANGGNPLDISPFAWPEGTAVKVDGDGGSVTSTKYPNSGVVAPLSADPMDRAEVLVEDADGNVVDSGFGQDMGGWLNTDRYYPARQGGRADRGQDSDAVVTSVHLVRKWANQEIKERLQDMEWRIIKLCDLREQLIQERDEILVQAFGGALRGVGPFDSGRFDPDHLVQNIVHMMYSRLYTTDTDGVVVSTKANEQVPLLTFTFDDLPSELRDPMGC